MRHHAIVSLALLVSLSTIGLAGGQDMDLAGTWIGKTDVPDVGPVVLTLVLTKSETGYAGIWSDDMGILAKDTPLRDVKLEGNHLAFVSPLATGEMVAIALKVEAGKMAGTWTHEGGDTGALTFERKK